MINITVNPSVDNQEHIVLLTTGLYGVTTVLSLLGNGLFLMVVMHFRKPLSSTEASLTQLAVSNILLAISHMFIMARKLQGGHEESRYLVFINQATFCSCILLLMCVAVHQCRNTAAAQGSTTPRYYLVLQLILVWLLALLSSIPDALPYFDNKNRGTYDKATIILGIFTLLIQLTLTFLLPLVVITVCYSIILQAVRETAIRRKRRVCQLVIALLTSFYIFQLPRAVGTCMEVFQPNKTVIEFIYIVSTFSCVCLIIYAFFWQKFQRKTKELFFSSLCCQKPQVNVLMTAIPASSVS